jgi:pimeloyl-ACP methyl ester carboxylesterase
MFSTKVFLHYLSPPLNKLIIFDNRGMGDTEKIPDARLALYENGGHGLMFQYPEKFSGKVIDFLK